MTGDANTQNSERDGDGMQNLNVKIRRYDAVTLLDLSTESRVEESNKTAQYFAGGGEQRL